MWIVRTSATATAEQRLVAAKALNQVSWWGAGIVIALRIAEAIPMQWGSLSVLFIGTGIASSVALSRISLANTITDAFTAGLRAASAPREQISCVIEVGNEGDIEHVAHPEVIHWGEGELEGLPLETIIPKRFLAAHRKGFQRYRETGEARVAGATLNVPVLGSRGNEYAMKLSVSHIGNTFVGTLTPTSAPVGDTPAVLASIQTDRETEDAIHQDR